MEHSLLHALQLAGIIIALGGGLFVPGFLRPAARSFPPGESSPAIEWEAVAAQCVFWAALIAGFSSALDLLVQVAEIRGRTIYAGVDIHESVRYLLDTVVGRTAGYKTLSLFALVLAIKFLRRGRWECVAALSLAAGLFSALVSHSAALPTHRVIAIVAQFSHIGMGALWIGVLIQIFAGRRFFSHAPSWRSAKLLSRILQRFSPVALAAVVLITTSGLYAVCRFLDSPSAVLSSPYGLTLSLKLLLMLIVLGTGWRNWRVIRPALFHAVEAGPENWNTESAAVLKRFSRLLELEISAGLLVITVAGILGSIAPPGGDGVYRLNSSEIHAILTPDLPTTRIVNPARFAGAETRTGDDLRYAEFTHNWSGVLVAALGLCWLGQSITGRRVFARARPILLLPFAAFVTVAADPEVWILRSLSWSEAVSDPQIFEHQIGAALLLILVWLGWRDAGRSADKQLLGYALPGLLIVGSLMLLGHAHTSLTGTEQLGTLINAQHAIFGAFGLFAGVLRWFQLRSLIPARYARVLWPGCVFCLGIFMAFFYREVI
jgi:putative copper export protein